MAEPVRPKGALLDVIILLVRPKGGRAVFRIVVALLYVVCIFGFDVRVPTVIFVAALHVVAFCEAVRPNCD